MSIFGALLVSGCVSVKAPDKIIINDGESKRVNTGHVPAITTVEEGRTELDRAYRNLRLLQEENHELARDKEELKRERNRYKHERDECREKSEKSNHD